MKKSIALLVVTLLVCCNKADQGSQAASTDVAPPAPPPAASSVVAQRVSDRSGADAGVPAGLMSAPDAPAKTTITPMIVRTAEMRIIVADTTKTVDAVTKQIEAMGGFVSGSNVWRDGELMRASLKLRIPSDKLTAALQAIRVLAKRVDNESIASEDVSQEYVDLESQVRNLEATENELRELLITARQNSKKASDVLEVHQQLTMIRGQIEQAKGRMRYLSQVASMSSISLDVVPDAIARPVVQVGWQPMVIVKNAMRALVGAMQSAATVGIWFVIYILPIFGMLAFVLALLWKLARRSRMAA